MTETNSINLSQPPLPTGRQALPKGGVEFSPFYKGGLSGMTDFCGSRLGAG